MALPKMVNDASVAEILSEASKLKSKKYELKDEKVGGSNNLSRNKKLNLLEFIKNAEKEKTGIS